MKKIGILILGIVIATIANAGNNKKYIKTMEGTIEQLYAAQTVESFDPVTNKFTRIAEAEGDKWMPYYYAALSNVFKSFRMKDMGARDGVLDQAQAMLVKAAELDKGNSEITALDGFIYMMKISVDPGTRGQSLSPKAMAAFGSAMQQDPSNPRAVLFMGQMHHGMAQFFGSGVEEACATILKSVGMFETSKPESTIAPAWGANTAKQWAERCQQPLEDKSGN